MTPLDPSKYGAPFSADAFAPLITTCKVARERVEQRRRPGVVWIYPGTKSAFSYLDFGRDEDECHYCGAPSPGNVCRYCATVHREPDSGHCPKCRAEYRISAHAADNYGAQALIARACECDTTKVYEVFSRGAPRYLYTVAQSTGEGAT